MYAMYACMHACMHACMYVCLYVLYVMHVGCMYVCPSPLGGPGTEAFTQRPWIPPKSLTLSRTPAFRVPAKHKLNMKQKPESEAEKQNPKQPCYLRSNLAVIGFGAKSSEFRLGMRV